MKNISEKCTDCNKCRGEKTAGLKIAVSGNETTLPASFQLADRMEIFEKQNDVWVNGRTENFPEFNDFTPAGVRDSAERLIPLIEDCAAVAGPSVSGIIFSIFDKHGKHIFEISEVSQEQLTGIAEDIALAEAKINMDSDAFEKAAPAQTETPGVFTLDLIEIQKQFPELTSKMILKPFLKNTPFLELVIICRHIPAWLDSETAYRLTQKRKDDHMLISLVKKPV